MSLLDKETDNTHFIVAPLYTTTVGPRIIPMVTGTILRIVSPGTMVGPGTSTGPSPNGPSSPNGLNCIIDKGAQRSCIGKKKFINIGGNPDNLSKSTHSYIFGDGKPSPSIGNTKIVFGNHEFYMDVVSRDVPGLIGMDILDRKTKAEAYFNQTYLKGNCWQWTDLKFNY